MDAKEIVEQIRRENWYRNGISRVEAVIERADAWDNACDAILARLSEEENGE